MMGRVSWKAGWVYCEGINAKGQPCGNKVPKGFRRCYAHRRQALHVNEAAERQQGLTVD